MTGGEKFQGFGFLGSSFCFGFRVFYGGCAVSWFRVARFRVFWVSGCLSLVSGYTLCRFSGFRVSGIGFVDLGFLSSGLMAKVHRSIDVLGFGWVRGFWCLSFRILGFQGLGLGSSNQKFMRKAHALNLMNFGPIV